MADTPEYQRGAGDAATGTPMPQGEASQLNEAVSALPDQAASAPQAEAAPAPEVQPAQASDYQPIYQPDTPDDQFLTGPTLLPGEPITAGANQQAQVPVPKNIASFLPVFAEAAAAPDAPLQLKLLVQLLTRYAGQ